MKIVLLTGNFENKENICYALETIGNTRWIDIQIEELSKLNVELDVVLGAKYGDEIMSESRLLRTCNLVFDPNESVGSPLSNLHAALFAMHGEGYILPVQFKSPHFQDWKKLINLLVPIEERGFDILRPYCPVDGDMAPGYPLGITRTAKKTILGNKKVTTIEDYQLKEYKLPLLDSGLTKPYATQHSY